MMARRKLIYRGDTKSLYESNSSYTFRMHFRDDSDGSRENPVETFEGKGVLNNRISEHIMHHLGTVGIATHLVRRENMREQTVLAADVLPVRIKIRNFAGEDIQKRLGLTESERLPRPLIEFYLKDKSLGCPLVTEDHLSAFGWAGTLDLDEIYPLAGRANDFLSGMMAGVGFTLAEFTIEVGRIRDEEFRSMVLVDELSPDVFHLWDDRSSRRYFFGRPAEGDDGESSVHAELARRLGIMPARPLPTLSGKISKVKGPARRKNSASGN